ncbi:hypothetical protein PBR31_00046 [Xanthomonas phage PBR31]|uniref:Uncharacterized protein n=1 Tax=Xanthomonas phage PPDBI TaxID=2723911 RepID=A0A6H0X5S5_9CAUD|nr:hypothetical protein PBR31_00046 [Xanthomonas phage PBR31]QIW89405.1 hypothetical protein PPDBI_00046 [Xanthomonas phage PPDBI]
MKPKAHDPNHPYVQRFIGCGHGVLFTEPCVDCEIVGLLDEYKTAVRKVQRTRDRLRSLGVKLPGNTSAMHSQERSDG